jgi:hypothetical protein
MYKQVSLKGVIQDIVLREDGAYIPFDPANSDYQTYLEWLAEGNTPLPAEE